MAELTNRERLLPYLLDRLTNDQPHATQESVTARAWSLRQAHAAVIRDLIWLLNTPRRSVSDDGLDEFPEVAKSVLNYGMPDLCGLTASSVSPEELERTLLQSIYRYEPRVQRSGLTVRVVDNPEPGRNNAVALEIRGEIWATPMPDSLYLKTELDLESGQCDVRDRTYG